jgi:hypothetical protein
MRGQTSVEYLLVLSIMLTLIYSISVAGMRDPARRAADNTLSLSQASAAADSMAAAIDAVYANGPGAVMSVGFETNGSWTLQLDNSGGVLRVRLSFASGPKDFDRALAYPIDNFHELTGGSGTYTAIVEWPTEAGAVEELDGSELDNGKIFIRIKPRGR